MERNAIEVSAPDVDKAIERGLAQLGLSRKEVQVQVIDAGSRGILGIGAREAIVRLTPVVPSGQEQSTTDKVKRESAPEPAPEPTPEPAREPVLEPVSKPQPQPAQVAQTPQPQVTDQEPEPYDFSQDQVAHIAQQTLIELLEKMGIDSKVVIRPPDPTDPDPSPITLDVLGNDAEVLIGRQGEVLNALQYLSRLIVSREVEHWVNMVVDVERYKQRRAKSLQQLAERIADRVARTKQPVALEPMPPNERRVIHIALVDHPSVTTQSVGKGQERKVTIIPRR